MGRSRARAAESDQVQELLQQFPDATQVDDHSINWNDGKVVLVLLNRSADELSAEPDGTEVSSLDVSSQALAKCSRPSIGLVLRLSGHQLGRSPTAVQRLHTQRSQQFWVFATRRHLLQPASCLNYQQKKVEAAGVEPASEDESGLASTRVGTPFEVSRSPAAAGLQAQQANESQPPSVGGSGGPV